MATTKRIHPSPRAREDFAFYASTPLDMIGTVVGSEPAPTDPHGYTALECWYQQDTYGERLPCCEPDLLAKVERAKQSWNLQVRLWAESMVDPLVLQQEELVDHCHALPSWIFTATMRQAGKLHLDIHGWIPRFLRLVQVYGQWWPPYLDDFDPAI